MNTLFLFLNDSVSPDYTENNGHDGNNKKDMNNITQSEAGKTKVADQP
ncbi:hypothetical protein DYBT9275_02150 [Dyadobacter sp. CECT 9275]|uniref:Uncharacterized protein n=1 Tax=Dyadobacter helix TaxID=2822344 RepID=A0A916NBN6_9BACT|nr:hypothetical protein DYBT9275_02150 [Dyadobacter sp. CECT 9275]